jgi:hypothetical protein
MSFFFVSLSFRSTSALLALTAATFAQGVKLSGALARPIGGDIYSYELNADGRYVFYIADQDQDDVFELYSTRTNGIRPPLKIAGTRVTGGDIFSALVTTQDRVVFAGDLDTDGVSELYSAPAEGGGFVKLNGPLVDRGQVRMTRDTVKVNAAGARVVYMASQDIAFTTELYSVPIAGGAAVKLNPAFLSGQDIASFEIASGAARVVYRANQDLQTAIELYSVPLLGGASVRLSPAGLGIASGFRIDEAGGRVAFVVTAGAGTQQLMVAPLDGSAPAQTLLTSSNVTVRALTPDGSQAICVVRRPSPLRSVLIAVKLDGSGVLDLHSELVSSNRFVFELDFTSDSRTLAFTVGPVAYDLYRAPLDGSAPELQLAQTLAGGRLEIDPSDRLVAHLGPQGELMSTRLDGSFPPTAIADHADTFHFTFDGGRVVYTRPTVIDFTSVVELFSVPSLGTSAPLRLSLPFPYRGSIGTSTDPAGFRLNRAGRAVYLADQFVDERFELLSVAADGSSTPRRVSGELPIGSVQGDVRSYTVSPDGDRAVYLADSEIQYQTEIFSVLTLGGSAPVSLHGPLGVGEHVESFTISSGGASVLYVLVKDISLERELRSVPIEGGPSALVAGPFTSLEVVATTASKAAFVVRSGGGVVDLLVAPVAGGAPPTTLHGGLTGLAGVLLTPNQARLVYTASASAGNGLFSVELNGASSPIPLDVGNGAGGLVLSADGTRAVYSANGLFSVLVDGSALPVRLSPLPGFVQVFPQKPLARGAWVFYRANHDDPNKFELYRATVDGSAAAIKLNAPLVSRGNVLTFGATSDGSRVVYQADQELDERFELYSAPAAGGGPVVKLNGALGNGDVGGDSFLEDIYYEPFVISPDGARVVFRAKAGARPGTERDLYSAPIDGGAPAIQLNPSVADSGVLAGVRFTPDGRAVLYRSYRFPQVPQTPWQFAVYRAAVDVPMSARRLSGVGATLGLGPGPDLFAFTLTPRGERVVYQLDQDEAGVIELFSAFVPRAHGAQRR